MSPDLPPALPDQGPLDLTSDEIAELDGLLASPPGGQPTLSIDALDGYLCGVLVQPVVVDPRDWLVDVFQFGAGPGPLPDGAWQRRVRAFAERRLAALNRTLVEDGWFEPIVQQPDDEHPFDVSEYEPLAALAPVSQVLAPWVHGFMLAQERFGALHELADAEIDAQVALLERHRLPAPDAPAHPPVFDRVDPLAGLDDAIDELVLAVREIADRTRERRYRVETVRRDAPKVGRNEPCPCGSGRKFKHCHGAG